MRRRFPRVWVWTADFVGEDTALCVVVLSPSRWLTLSADGTAELVEDHPSRDDLVSTFESLPEHWHEVTSARKPRSST